MPLKIFNRTIGPKRSHRRLSAMFSLILFAALFSAGTVQGARDRSDLNKDRIVDLADLELFSLKFIGEKWESIDWCQWIVDNPDQKNQYTALYDFIRSYFHCTYPPPPPPPPPPPEDPLEVVNKLGHPTRLTWDLNEKLYVTDAQIGSVFIHDSGLNLTGELKGINEPLGIAVNSVGDIFVGSNGSDAVQIYDYRGEYLRSIEGIGMPNDMAFDRRGNLYVADSVNDAVKVYDSSDTNILTFFASKPMALALKTEIDAAGLEIGELFVAELGSSSIGVFDLQGNWLRSIGQKVGSFGSNWHGKFVRLQNLAIDSLGRIHALDCYLNKVQIFDPETSAYILHYPTGEEPDHINLLLDIAIRQDHETAAANYGRNMVEIIEGW